MTYDLIIVTQSSPALIPVTQNCIDSAIADTKDINIMKRRIISELKKMKALF